MSDIVERLRYPEGAHLNPVARDVMLKAADEIERLRAEIVQQCRKYETDMRTMQDALNREIEARRALEPKP